MNMRIAIAETSGLVTESALCAWLGSCTPGDHLTYHRGHLLVDTDMAMLLAARARVADLGPAPERPIACATLTGGQDVLRDAVADTVIGTAMLSGIGDVRGFLATVHRVLRPNGRARRKSSSRGSWHRSDRRRSTIRQTKESTGTTRSVRSLPRGT